jgi:hypothetical protein
MSNMLTEATVKFKRISIRTAAGDRVLIMRFDVLVVLILKIDVLWDVTPYDLIDVYLRFGWTLLLPFVEYAEGGLLRNVAKYM